MNKQGAGGYKELIVWQKAHLLAVRTIEFVQALPNSSTAEVMGRQLLSAVSSIGANIAEGYGRGGRRQYVQYLGIARGSASEADNWFRLFNDAGLGNRERLPELLMLCEEILKMLTKMLRPAS